MKKYYIILDCMSEHPSLQLTNVLELTGLPILELVLVCVSSRSDA